MIVASHPYRPARTFYCKLGVDEVFHSYRSGGVEGEAGDEERLWREPQGKRNKNKAEVRADRKLKAMAAGAEQGRCYTLNEIAVKMGVTRERVRQIEQKALMKLHKRFKQVFKSEGVTVEEVLEVFRSGVGSHEHDVFEKE